MDHKEDISKLCEKYYSDEPKSGTKRGYKLCSCGERIPARCRTCPFCEKTIEKGEVYKPEIPLTPEQIFERKYINKVHINGRVVYIPIGTCPVEPILTKKGIEEWCELVVDFGRGVKLIYMPSVLKYWLRNYVDINSKEYKEYNTLIDNWVDGWIDE